MGTTPNLNLPWPALTDPADGPGAFQSLANLLDQIVYRPYVELVASAATTVPNATETKINLATTAHIDAAYFSVAASVVTILQSGTYNLGARALIGTAGTGPYVAIFKTNVTTKYLGFMYGRGGDVFVPKMALAANDTIELRMLQNSGSSQSTSHTSGAPTDLSRLFIEKVA